MEVTWRVTVNPDQRQPLSYAHLLIHIPITKNGTGLENPAIFSA